MTDSVKVTVYVPSRDYGRFLPDAIESVLRQSLASWELLLIDDASSDETAEVMARYRGDPRVRVLRTEGVGLPAVANLALRHARGEYLIRVDADDVLDEDALLVLGHHLDRRPEVALVFPDYYLIDEHGEVYAQERRGRLYTDTHLLDLPPNGACTMIRVETLRSIGGYREDLGARDGLDLWTRIAREHKSGNVNLPLFYYRRHGRNLTDDSVRILSAQRAIKRDAALAQLEAYRPIAAVIPCRKNYDLCPDLWRESVGDGTLLSRSIDVCRASAIFDAIVVAADTDEAKAAIDGCPDPRVRYVPRPTSETMRSRSIVPSLELVVRTLGLGWDGTIVLAYIQSPFKTTAVLEEAIFTLVVNGADSAFAAEEIREPLYRRTAHGLLPLNPRRPLSTEFDAVYRETGTTMATRNRNLRSGSLTGARVVNFVVPKRESFFIDSLEELAIARALDAQR